MVIYRRAIQCVLLFLAISLTGLALGCGPVAQPAPEGGPEVVLPVSQQNQATPEPTVSADVESTPVPANDPAEPANNPLP